MEKQENGHLFLQERQEHILKLLKKERKVMVPDLCRIFQVSSATIRSDLNEMERKGLLVRTHGGAILNTKTGLEKIANQKLELSRKEKELIGIAAADMVEDGDIIAVDTGTTTMAFVQKLISKKKLTVVTNDLEIASVLEEQSDANVVLVGGTLRRGFHCTIGPMALAAMRGIRVDKCFMGTNGLTPEVGISTPDLNHAEMKRVMISIASQLIVLCDSSKFGNNSFCQVAPISAVDVIITDSGADPRLIKAIEEQDVIVKLCAMENPGRDSEKI